MTTTEPLFRIDRGRIDSAVETITDAFADDPGVKRLRLSPRTVRTVHEMQVRHSLESGEVVATSERCEGVMLFCAGDRAGTSFLGLLRSGMLLRSIPLLRVFANKQMRSVIRTIERDRKNLDIGPFYYLSVIGVRRVDQGRGHGGRLLRYLVERADREGMAVYLETQTEKNVGIYSRFGFEVLRRVDINDWMPMWEMARRPIA